MSQLNFPTDGLYEGYQYVGDNGVTYIWDGTKWIGHSSALPPGTSALVNNGHILQLASNGNLVTSNFIFPATSGTVNQVLVWPGSGNTLVWANQSGTGGGGYATTSTLVNGTSVLSLDSNGTLKTIDPNLQIQVGESYAPYWVAEYGGFGTSTEVANDYAYGTGAVYDSRGNLYILGTASATSGPFGYDSLLLKYDPAGNLLWHKTWHDPVNGGNCGATNVAVAIDSNDRIYWVANDWTAGGMWTGYMDTDGNLGLGGVAQQVLGINQLYPTDLACDTSGNYYISGAITGGGTIFESQYGQPIVVKISGNAGTVVWTSDLTPIDSNTDPSTGLYRAVTVNPATGDVWAVGDYLDISDTWAMLTKWNSAGVHQWTKKLVTYSGDKGEAVVFNNDHVYTVVNDGTEVKVVVSKFNTNGTLIWASSLAEAGPNPQGYDLSFDAQGNVYLTGILDGHLWLTKLNPATGTMLYSRRLATEGGEYITDGSGDPLVGHRVGDIYQDKIAIAAITSSDLAQSNNFNDKIIIAQLPIDGSTTGTFNTVQINNITGEIAGSCTTGTYSVTPLSWTTGTIGTDISTLSQLSASAVTTVGRMSSRVINLTTATRATVWNFSQDGGLAFPDGTVQYSAAAGTATRWDATPAVEGCPIYAELTPDWFQVYTQQSHLEINNDATWHIGSNFNGNGLYSIDNTATLYSNLGEVIVRTGDSSQYFTFRANGSLALPESGKLTSAVTPQVGQKVTGIETYTTSTGGTTYSWHIPDCPNLVDLGYQRQLIALGSRFYPVGHPEQAVTITGGGGDGTNNTITFSDTLGAGPYIIESSDYVAAHGNDVVIETNGNDWTFSTSGTLTLPATNKITAASSTATGWLVEGVEVYNTDLGSNTYSWTPASHPNFMNIVYQHGGYVNGIVFYPEGHPEQAVTITNVGSNLPGPHWDITFSGPLGSAPYVAHSANYTPAYDNPVVVQASSSTWSFGTDGVLTLPGGNTRIGNFNDIDAIVASTNTAFAVLSQGIGGYAALQWIDDPEDATAVAAVVVNSPIASSSGTVQIATGVVSGPAAQNVWEFGADGVLNLPGTVGDIKRDGLSVLGGGNGVLVATTSTAPTATTGTQWFNTIEGRTYVALNNQWVDASPTVIPPPSTYLEDLSIDGDDLYDANGSVIRVAAEDTPPTRVNGQLWYDTLEGRAYIKYNDQWVDFSPTVIPPPSTYLGDIEIDGSTLYINNATLTVDDSGTLLVNGGQVSGGGGASGWQITSGSYNVSIVDTGVVTMATSRGNIEFGALPECIGGVSHFHIMKASASTAVDLYFGDDYNYVLQRGNSMSELEGHTNDYGVEIGTRDLSTGTSQQYVWRFETDGVLTLSTASTILGSGTDPNVYIETSTLSTTSTWTFGTNGILTLPAATPVIKGGGTGTDVTIIASTGSNTSTWTFGADGTLTLPQNVKIGDYPGFGPAGSTAALYGAQVYLASTNGNSSIGVENGTPVIANGSTSTWYFGIDGKLTLPVAGAQIASDVTFLGNVTFSNSATYVVSTNTVYTDSLVEIHAPSGGVGGSWASNDGNDIGFRFHYYNGTDTNAALFMDNGTWRLKWVVDGVETGGQFVHSGLGDIEAQIFYGQSMRSGSYDGNQINLTTGGGADISSLRDGAVYIKAGTDGSVAKYWGFDHTGAMTFPDYSVQTTAWTGTVAYSNITGAPSSSSFPAGIVFNTTELDSTGTSTYSLFNTPTTLNIANSSSTGTVNIASGPTVSGSTVNLNLGTNGLAGSITNVNIGSQISGATSVITAYGVFRGYQVQERFSTLTPANASTATLDCSTGNIFNINMGTLGQNWTPWLTNLNLPQNYITTISIIVNQTGTAYLPTSVVIPGATNTTFTWQGGSTPTGSANRKDVIAYNIYSTQTNYYTVLAQLVSF